MNVRVLFAFALLVSSCKTKPGATCSGANVCDGPEKALLCVDGKYVVTSCKGPDRCIDAPFNCDFRGSAAGEDCTAPPGGSSRCAPDGKARIECLKGKVSREECDGARGCYQRPNGTSAACDTAFKLGGACGADGDWCSTDGKDWLTCNASKLALAGKCRGPGGCKTIGEGIVACDVSIADLNDVCAGKGSACTSDGTTVLSCRDGTMRVDNVCPQGKSCRHSDATASCAGK